MFDLSDPGTGKTRAHAEVYAARANPGRLLVVCPKSLMHSAWGNDFERFTPGLTVSFATADNRAAAFEINTDVVVINTDGVVWLAKEGKSYLKHFDHLIIDEFTTFKHRTSQRSKAIASMRKAFKYRFLLSGTPNAKSVTELWHPALLLDDGVRLGTSFTGFRNAVQTPTQRGPSANHIEWNDKPGAVSAVDDLLKDVTIRHAFEDVMAHVPPNHKDTKEFTLSPRATKAYTQLENEAIIMAGDQTISAVHAASMRNKLLQLASGAVYDTEGGYAVIDRQRYIMIADLIEERDHSVTFFNWKHQRDELSKEFTRRGISFEVLDGDTPARRVQEIVRAYQNGEYKTLLLHPRTGAHGLTLTRGTTTIIASPIYEADLLRQAVHRIYRGEQDRVTNTLLVQAKGTVEEYVYSVLFDRTARMDDFLGMVRDRRKA